MTGGTGKLGIALIQALTTRGAIVGSTVRGDSARSIPADIPVERVDLAEADRVGPAIEALAERLGGVDIFLHGAARTEGGFDDLFAVNVRAAVLAVSALQKRLAGGQIALLGSVAAIKAMEAPALLTSTHGALAALARAWGKELGGQGTRVNYLALGPLTDGASRAISPELRAEYVKHACSKRQFTPDEAASAIASFLLKNTYVTGQAVTLDGGL